jgi:hypothetical protein
MPATIVMQDLVTVTTSISGQVISQQESLWVDLLNYQDLGLMIYFAQVPASFTGNVAFYIDHAPLKEEGLFTVLSPLVSVTAAPGTNPGWNFYGPFHLSSGQLFSRFARWRVTNGTSASVSTWQFRILLSANQSAR